MVACVTSLHASAPAEFILAPNTHCIMIAEKLDMFFVSFLWFLEWFVSCGDGGGWGVGGHDYLLYYTYSTTN